MGEELSRAAVLDCDPADAEEEECQGNTKASMATL